MLLYCHISRSTPWCMQIASRVDGAELLEAAEAAGQGSEDDDFRMSSSGSDSDADIDAGSNGLVASECKHARMHVHTRTV